LRKKDADFLKKAAQKTVDCSEAGMLRRRWPRLTDVFSVLFLQQKTLFLPYQTFTARKS
jgi:hypothetical protein